MNEQRNLILAIVLSAAILAGYQWRMSTSQPHADGAAPVAAGAPPVPTANAPASAGAPVPLPGAASAAPAAENWDDALAQSRRVPIRTPDLAGSVSLTGGRIDDLTLTAYHETSDANSPPIRLLAPTAAREPYYAEFGWVTQDAGVALPGADTIWSAAPNAQLSPATPLVLSWDNKDGLRFIRTIAVDDQYMFTVTQRVENYGPKPVALYPYAFLSRAGTPNVAGTYILHEGPLGVLDGTLKEHKYADLKKDPLDDHKTIGGWIGITDKYWLAALIPDQKAEVNGRFIYQGDRGIDRYQVDVTRTQPLVVAPNSAVEDGVHLFAGAKIVDLLDGYGQSLGIDKFDLAIDFGWFWFLTKPFFYILRMLHQALGNMGLAIMALTVVIKLAMFPLANKSFEAMAKMKKLQPEIQKLQARFGEDKVRQQQEMMALYKAEKVNPASGCLPVLVQIPVFFALYKVLFVTIEMRQAPFIGWIHDLSAPDPTTVFNLFGLLPFDPPGFLQIGLWPLVMGLTMWGQQKMNPQPADPVQAKMFQFLPIIFTFLLGKFAAGLVIYWAWSNSLSILQQWVISRRAAAKG